MHTKDPGRKADYELVLEAEAKLLLTKEEADYLQTLGPEELLVTLTWRQKNGKARSVTLSRGRVHIYGEW